MTKTKSKQEPSFEQIMAVRVAQVLTSTRVSRLKLAEEYRADAERKARMTQVMLALEGPQAGKEIARDVTAYWLAAMMLEQGE